MTLTRRLEWLEDATRGRRFRYYAGRLAEECGVSVERALQHILEIAERLERYGLDAEFSRIAEESGRPEEQVRAYFERALARSGD